MAVKPHDVMKEKTASLEEAFYQLLRVSDDYGNAVQHLLADERGSDAPREQLMRRLDQLSDRISRIIKILEDDALTEMLWIIDRRFALGRAERGEDI